MAITSDEIANKEFLVGLRGYDKDEVRTFLRTVAEAFEGATAPTSNDAPTDAEPTPVASTPAPPIAQATAPTSTGNLGEQIEAILATATTEADKLRTEAAADAARMRTDADAYAETTRAEAEQRTTEAHQKLTAAQDEALSLVADAQARVDKMLEASRLEAEAKAKAAVAALASEADELRETNEAAKVRLGELRTRIDAALATTDTEVHQ